jgi:ectoine hydroxylase-related dioxygenase (phytanoyl-CoA dioxygenase family)
MLKYALKAVNSPANALRQISMNANVHADGAPVDFATHCSAIQEEGYTVFTDVLSEAEITAYRAALQPWLDKDLCGRNVFEGTRSHRVYAMLAKNPIFAELVMHPLALTLAEHFLGESCLLSACLAIELMPGESAQPWHTDDGHVSLKPPHKILGISAFWALSDTTVENGATEVLPRSHLWAEQDLPGALTAVDFDNTDGVDEAADHECHSAAKTVTLTAGSLMVARGDLWHRGGANLSGGSRLIVTPQYCAGWLRPLETMLLTMTPAQVAAFPERLQALLGYSIHAPFMGYVDGMHPKRILGA